MYSVKSKYDNGSTLLFKKYAKFFMRFGVVYENVIQVIKYSQCCTVLIQQNRLQNSAPNLIIVKITLYLYFRITNT
jgi:hypothetical protein